MSHGAYGTAALPGGRLTRTARRSPTALPLALAGACLVALVAVWALAVHVPAVRSHDGTLLRHFLSLRSPGVDGPAKTLLHSLNPPPFCFWAAALLCVAIARGRPRTALAAAAVVGLAILSSETLKPLLASGPRYIVGPASWPSGHSTAAAALAVAAVLVAPARWRVPVALAGVVIAGAVGVALLMFGLHMPSDVLGGYLVVAFWTSIAVAALRYAEQRWPTRREAHAD
jgi:membrane-associated phospholipid phosphatase